MASTSCAGGVYGELRWRVHAEEVAAALRGSPLFERTIYLMQEDYSGHFCNQLIGYGYLPTRSRVFRYRTAREPGPPTRSFSEGIRHRPGTLADAVNCAYCFGWSEIVLVGVDLYDSRYFWLPADKTLKYDEQRATLVAAEVNDIRGNRFDDLHPTAASGGVVDQMAEWGRCLADDGITLSVYNPRSLLADVLPVYDARPVASA